MRRETLSYDVDGVNLRSEMFVGDGEGALPGVLVYPHGYGLDAHALDRAERLAAMGYAALACDLHGEAKAYTDTQEMVAAIQPLMLEPLRIRARALGSFAALAARPEVDAARIAATGYCMGGTMAFEVARSGAAIVAAIGFHGGLKTPRPAERLHCEILALLGADDPVVPAEERRAFEEEMRGSQARWQMTLYGGVVHSFTDRGAAHAGAPHVARYDAWADERSWAEMSALLTKCFGTGGRSVG